jgi:hypothetical protein
MIESLIISKIEGFLMGYRLIDYICAIMLRKAICIIILSSMALHCAARLGLLDYLYAKRSSFAFSLGLTAEKVIASCGLGHYQEESLAMADEGDHPGNPIGSQAFEILVFFQASAFVIPINFSFTVTNYFLVSAEKIPSTDGKSLFHPPTKRA